MAPNVYNFSTGPASITDVGTLIYNGCLFSPLYETTVSGKCVKDDATRTVKYMEYTIAVDGYVTLPDGASDISPTMTNLRKLLTAQGGALTYVGRGNDIRVNIVGGTSSQDVAWGPAPEMLDFQPLGGGNSAKIKWVVKVQVVENGSDALFVRGGDGFDGGVVIPGPSAVFRRANKPADLPRLLQFNYESTVSYGEDGFSTLSVKGILEIPLTRSPTQATRTFQQTADDFRGEIERRVMSGIDLGKFRMVKRDFNLSRDKRSLNWDFQAEERPYMDPAPDCNITRGSFNVRPAKAGMGLCTWMCSLRATYTVRNDRPRRAAWLMFLALLRHRMAHSNLGNLPNSPNSNQAPVPPTFALRSIPQIGQHAANAIEFFRNLRPQQAQEVVDAKKAMLIDFGIDEGIYNDSKTVTFNASWKITTTLSHILLASGLWRRVNEDFNSHIWASTVRDASGVQSWEANKGKPDIIVDFSGG